MRDRKRAGVDYLVAAAMAHALNPAEQRLDTLANLARERIDNIARGRPRLVRGPAVAGIRREDLHFVNKLLERYSRELAGLPLGGLVPTRTNARS
jgi:hypothetical protein